MTERKPRLWLSPNLALPLGAVTETIAILGIRGSGKTNTAGVFAEELLDCGQQVVVIDPTDVWWGLKSSADGKAKGFPVVVLGGRRADLPLAAADGATLADFVCDTGTSIVLSLRHFESKHDQQRFITEFARRLYWRKGQVENPSPLMLIIDEASLVVPQRVQADEAQMVGAIQKLVRQGRSSGIGVTLIDQRAATINKDVLTQLELLICHRTTSPQDRKALEAWVAQHDTLDQGDEFLESLARLAQGTAWFWSPGWLDVFTEVDVRLRKTFDSSRTPKPGETVTGPTAVAPVDLDALRGKLAATLEKARQDDPKELRRRIAELERAAKSHKPITETKTVERTVVDQQAIETAVVTERNRCARIVSGIVLHVLNEAQDASELAARAKAKADALLVFIQTPDASIGDAPIPRVPDTRRPPIAAQRPPVIIPPRSSSNGTIDGSQQKVLDALATLFSLGNETPKRVNVAFMSGYTVGGRFNNLIGSLRTLELIDYPGDGQVALTQHGHQYAEALSISSRRELHGIWLEKVEPSAARLLQVLIDRYPDAISRDTLASETDYEIGGRFNNLVGHLVSLGAARYPQKGLVVATDNLFPEGMPA